MTAGELMAACIAAGGRSEPKYPEDHDLDATISQAIVEKLGPEIADRLMQIVWGISLTSSLYDLKRINGMAEEDMLEGNPLTGAHHRAIEKRIKEIEASIRHNNACIYGERK